MRVHANGIRVALVAAVVATGSMLALGAEPLKIGVVAPQTGPGAESGRFQVERLVGGAKVLLAELKAGDAFGEEALVSEAKRNAKSDSSSERREPKVGGVPEPIVIRAWLR